MIDTKNRLHEALQTHFGFDGFKDNQETIIQNKRNMPNTKSISPDDNYFGNDLDISTHCFIDDDPSVCEDVRQWGQDYARDNGFFPDGTGWRPDSI